VNARLKLLLDPMVTSPAGGGNILRIDHRQRIGLRQFIMRTMTVRARCRDSQSALYQPLAMNALGVMFDNLVLGS